MNVFNCHRMISRFLAAFPQHRNFPMRVNARRVTRPIYPYFGVDHRFAQRNKKKKTNVRSSPRKKSRGSRGYLRPRRNWISFRDAEGREGRARARAPHCAWDIPARGHRRRGASFAPEGSRYWFVRRRFIRKCFRVSAGLRARLAYTPRQIFRFARKSWLGEGHRMGIKRNWGGGGERERKKELF